MDARGRQAAGELAECRLVFAAACQDEVRIRHLPQRRCERLQQDALAALRLHPRHDARERRLLRHPPAGAQLRRATRREPLRVHARRDHRHTRRVQALREQPVAVRHRVHEHAVAAPERPPAQPEDAWRDVHAPLSSANHP